MGIRYLFLFFFFFLIGTSCQTSKLSRLLTNGQVEQANFNEIIPFENNRNWIIIEARINNSSKIYKFMFDSGAVTVISPQLAKELNLETKVESSVGSATDVRKVTPFTKLDQVEIGGIHFQNIGTAIMDFNTSPDLGCLGREIDGLIGANLMKFAIWQIDFEKKTLQFTDDESNISIGEKRFEIPFTHKGQATPKLQFSVFGKKVKASLDTGKTGSIGLKRSKTFQNVDFEHDSIPAIKGYGITASGIFGTVTDTTYKVLIEDFKLGTLELDTTFINFAKRSSNLVGNGFLKNFKVTINWKTNKLILEPTQKRPKSIFFSDGWGYTLAENKLEVVFYYKNSPVERAKIPFGSQILKVGDQSFEQVSMDDYCKIRKDGFLYPKEIHEIPVQLKLPDGTIKTIQLTKERLL